jgi:DNA-binding NarL/FixJ family response regulator
MQRHHWHRRTSWAEVCARASGRRHYNSVRQFRAKLRQIQVARLLRDGLRQTHIAAVLSVHPSTVSRDVAALLQARQLWP